MSVMPIAQLAYLMASRARVQLLFDDLLAWNVSGTSSSDLAR